MNNLCLTGRITKEPELKTTQSGNSYLLFTLAVDRGFKDDNGNYITDFIPCVAWNNQAEFIHKYVQKGNMLEITGTIQSRTYQTQSGDNRTVIEAIIDSVRNLTPKPKEEIPAPQEPKQYTKKEQEIETNIIDDSDLPF